MLSDELRTAEDELAEAKKSAKEANERAASLERRVERWKGALAEATGQEPTQPEKETQENDGDGKTIPEINKAQIVRDVILANAEHGATIKDIREAFQKKGVTIHVNYPYAVIRRGKKNKTIREKNERYYPAEPKRANE
jgi:outer membrane protein TolC